MLDLRDRVSTAKKSADAGAAFRSLLPKERRDRMHRLADDPDTSVALKASFELHNNRNIDSKGKLLPDEERAFLRHMRTRIGLDPPAWWVKGFPAQFPWPEPRYLEYAYEAKNEESAVVFLGKDRLRLKTNQYNEIRAKNRGDRVAVKIGPESSYLARLDAFGWSYDLYCIETSTGNTVWRSKVWAVGVENHPGVRSVRTHGAEIEVTKDKVVVWGGGTGGCYVEAFDAATGKVLFRFCPQNWYIR